jgi:hypothetical protein
MTRTQNCGKCKLPKSLCPCGRPTKLTDEIVSKLKEAAGWDCTVEEMALHAGISKATYYVWCEKYPELIDEINRLRENPVLTARQTVVKSLTTDKPMALAYLSRKKRNEFGESVKVDMNTTGAVLVSNDPAVIAAENAIREQAEQALRGIMLGNPPKK